MTLTQNQIAQKIASQIFYLRFAGEELALTHIANGDTQQPYARPLWYRFGQDLGYQLIETGVSVVMSQFVELGQVAAGCRDRCGVFA
jgi:hypothetical protein